MMPHSQGSQDRNPGVAHPEESSAQGLHLVQDLVHEEEATSTVTSPSSFSYALVEDTAREEAAPAKPICPQNPADVSTSPAAIASSESSQCHVGCSFQEEAGASVSQDKVAPRISVDASENDELDMIVRFLLQKYQRKEQITVEEVMHMVDGNSPGKFPMTFSEICECMHLGFGIITKEVDSTAHTYELVSTLGLSYTGIFDDTHQIIHKSDLFILILSLIFLKGNRVCEEHLKEILTHRKILAETAIIPVEDAWKFITEDLVQAEYLVYQQVPNRDPEQYEFLWGPRALAETTRMKILEHTIMLDEKYPKGCPYRVQPPLRKTKGMLRVSSE